MARNLVASPDIIGFGALNVDYIASATRLSERIDERITESTARFEWNREGPVDQKTITAAIQHLGAASLSYSLGGSAWLSIFTLAQMQVGVKLGYVGILGRIETPGLSFTDQMDKLGIEHVWVGHVPDRLSGLCLSYIDDTDRVMLTHPGANFEMYRFIDDNFEELATYIASTLYVHVTSFLDDKTPERVLRVLRRAKEHNPDLQISFDPGFDWADHPSDAVSGLLAITDLLFVNYREFKALGRYSHGEGDESIAAKILQQCDPRCVIFVTKRYDFTKCFSVAAGTVVTQTFRLRRPLRESELEDATGAGDVFAAAVLSSLTSQRLKVEFGAFLGLSLAQYKAAQGGRGETSLPDLSRGFLERRETTIPPQRRPNPLGVFLVHHNSMYRDVVMDFLQNKCGLAVYELRTADLGRADLSGALAEQVPKCSFAVCLMDKNDFMIDGRTQAEPSTVYHAGYFQGKYGFRRVALLAEEGCDTFSNIAGIVRLDFPSTRVESTFIELRRMLQREGFMRLGKRTDA